MRWKSRGSDLFRRQMEASDETLKRLRALSANSVSVMPFAFSRDATGELVILPLHRDLDQAREAAATDDSTTSPRNGVKRRGMGDIILRNRSTIDGG